ncbi:MAG: efflux RND transporter permease subunit [Candidatus Omnitrophota bacterium]
METKMNLTDIFIKNDRVTFTLLLLIILGGIQAYISFPRNEDPEIIIRQAMVMTYSPGMAPVDVELLISEKIEKKIQELPELDYVQSENRTGVSLITVSIKEEYKDMRPIWDRLRNKVKDAEADLPAEASRPFVWDDYGDVFGIVLAITGDGFSYKEIEDIADDMKKELLMLPSVARVEMYGQQDQRVFIEVSNARLGAFGMTPQQLMGLLSDENIVLPGGQVFSGPEKIVIEPTGNYKSVEDIENTIISNPGDLEVVYLKDMAVVRRGYIEPPSKMMRYDGKTSLALAISMSRGGNIVELGDTVKDFIAGYIMSLPVGINVEFVNFMPENVVTATNDFMLNLLQSVLIVTIVMVLSLGLRTGVIVASLIPMSIFATFVFMSFLGIQLQRVSIASLIISLGLMVDCGIVMSENMMVLFDKGMDRLEACVRTGKELLVPLLTSTLTTCAAFLPIALAKSAVGEYCFSLFQVVTISLLCSWFIGLTVIPLFCFKFLRFDSPESPVFRNRAFRAAMITALYLVGIFVAKLPALFMAAALPFFFMKYLSGRKPEAADPDEGEFGTPFYRKYLAFLEYVLSNRKKVLIGILVFFIAALWGFGFVRKIFFPPSDRPQFYVNFDMPEGTSIYKTSEELKKLEDFLGKQKEINSFVAYIGEGGPRYLLQFTPEQAKENYAYVLVNCRAFRDVEPLIEKTRSFMEENILYGQPVVKQLESGAPVGDPVQVRISGNDIDTLYELAGQVKEILGEIPGTYNIKDDWGNKTKKIVIDVDQSRAKRVGLSSRDIADSLKMLMDEMPATQYREKDKNIPVALRSDEAGRNDIGKIEGMNVYSAGSTQSVPLSQLAREKLVWENSQIFRRNRWRTMTVKSQVKPGFVATQVLEKFIPRLEKVSRSWPAGYKYELGGEKEENEKAQQSIVDQLPVGAFIIVMLMIMQFNSMRRMSIIVITIPVAIIGVTAGLLATNMPFGFMALLGFISLAGIVINNAIVLIDRIELNIKEGSTPQRAIITATLSRTRPIMLTSITTVGGLIPLAAGGGEFWAPMAITIMSGLSFSTLLTLGFVPLLYAVFFRIGFSPEDFFSAGN